MTAHFVTDVKCSHGLPPQNCSLCSQFPMQPVVRIDPRVDELERRVQKLERLMELVCPDKSDDV